MNANSTIFAPVCCPENFDDKPLWPSRSAREAFCAISHKVEVPFVHKLDHQVLSGEADSDEVRLLTVGGETEEELFCRRSSIWRVLVEGCTKTTAEVLVVPDEAKAFATLLVSMCLLRRRTSTNSSAPMRDGCPRLGFKRTVSRQCGFSPTSGASKLRSRERMHACRSCARRWLR